MSVLNDLLRIGSLRFIMTFDSLGGTNFGACGMTETTARVLQRAEIIDVWLYKAPSTSYRRVKRRFRKVSRGAHMPRLAALLREELRARNLAAINGLEDGVGRVAFRDDWRTRRSDVEAAATRAWERLEQELRGNA
jgi:hypothetical protein